MSFTERAPSTYTDADHQQAAYDNWHVMHGADIDTLSDIGYATPESLPEIIANRQASEQITDQTKTMFEHQALVVLEREVATGDQIKIRAKTREVITSAHAHDSQIEELNAYNEQLADYKAQLYLYAKGCFAVSLGISASQKLVPQVDMHDKPLVKNGKPVMAERIVADDPDKQAELDFKYFAFRKKFAGANSVVARDQRLAQLQAQLSIY